MVTLALAISVLGSACGSDGGTDANSAPASSTDSGQSAGNTLTVGAYGTPEQKILAEIYAQALKRAGYEVRKTVPLGIYYADAGPKGIERGLISGYPDHLSTAAFSLNEAEPPIPPDIPGDPKQAYKEVREAFQAKGMTAFPPTEYGSARVVATLRSTADRLGLRKISDLYGKSKQVLITGLIGCHGALDCAGGLEQLYKLRFEGFVNTPKKMGDVFDLLEAGGTDLAMVPSTDGRIARGKKEIVLLEDDKQLFPPGNAVFVVSGEVAEALGPRFEETIADAQRRLTLPVMQELLAEVEIDKRQPAAVAAQYLKQQS